MLLWHEIVVKFLSSSTQFLRIEHDPRYFDTSCETKVGPLLMTAVWCQFNVYCLKLDLLICLTSIPSQKCVHHEWLKFDIYCLALGSYLK